MDQLQSKSAPTSPTLHDNSGASVSDQSHLLSCQEKFFQQHMPRAHLGQDQLIQLNDPHQPSAAFMHTSVIDSEQLPKSVRVPSSVPEPTLLVPAKVLATMPSHRDPHDRITKLVHAFSDQRALSRQSRVLNADPEPNLQTIFPTSKSHSVTSHTPVPTPQSCHAISRLPSPVDIHHSHTMTVTSPDDRQAICELMNRINTCTSDNVEHIFLFCMEITPLFQLQIVPDFILVKYLLPKVYGKMAKIFAEVAADHGNFHDLCRKVRLEIFCDRTSTSLAQKYFFQQFQSHSQSAGDFFEFMIAAYFFLQLPLIESDAVNIIFENLTPQSLLALAGHSRPHSFLELYNLTSTLNRSTMVSEHRRQFEHSFPIPTNPPTQLFHSAPLRYIPDNSQHLVHSISMQPPIPQFNRPRPFCFNCGNSDHLKPQCPYQPRRSIPDHTSFHNPPIPASITPNLTSLPNTHIQGNHLPSPLPPTNRRCHHCGDPSHFRPQCPQFNQPSQTSSLPPLLPPTRSSVPLRRCYSCGSTTHLRNNCPRINQQHSGNFSRAAW